MMATVKDGEGLAFKPNDVRIDRVIAKLEEGRPGALWLDLFDRRESHAELCRMLGLRFPCPATHQDTAALMAFSEIGLCLARIVICGALWREAMSDENGAPAAILPVGRGDRRASIQDGWSGMGIEHCLSMMGSHDHVFQSSPARVADLIAIPFSGGKALTFTGATAAVGDFRPDKNGVLTIAASGLGFLKRSIVRAREAAKDMPAQLVARTLPFPDRVEALVLEPSALEWRLDRSDCVIDEDVTRVVSPDSVQLARFVDEAMKKRDRVRKAPPVLAPKGGAA